MQRQSNEVWVVNFITGSCEKMDEEEYRLRCLLIEPPPVTVTVLHDKDRPRKKTISKEQWVRTELTPEYINQILPFQFEKLSIRDE